MASEAEILKKHKVIAVVGLSSNPERPSHEVAAYLKNKGYKIIPVNPNEKTILGETCYPDLSSIPDKVEVVDVFRRAEDCPPIAREAVKIGADVVWLQEGIVSEEAAACAREAGLQVVMDKCIKKEHMKMGGK
ncbi:MAG TPA: CoA-binding protein [Dehalococcoidales bacterium]|nr:CoA-binding protein [Dehalococcoidales bacterium]